MPRTNQQIILAFIEDVLNQGRWERMNDLVRQDFIELDPLPGQQQGREGLKSGPHAISIRFP